MNCKEHTDRQTNKSSIIIKNIIYGKVLGNVQFVRQIVKNPQGLGPQHDNDDDGDDDTYNQYVFSIEGFAAIRVVSRRQVCNNTQVGDEFLKIYSHRRPTHDILNTAIRRC